MSALPKSLTRAPMLAVKLALFHWMGLSRGLPQVKSWLEKTVRQRTDKPGGICKSKQKPMPTADELVLLFRTSLFLKMHGICNFAMILFVIL